VAASYAGTAAAFAKRCEEAGQPAS
jgi:hypothetical protein